MSRAAGDEYVIPGQYIVVLRDEIVDVPELARRLVKAHGGETLHVYRHALKGFAAVLPTSAVTALRRNPNVRLIEADVMDLVAQDTLDALDDPAGFEDGTPHCGLDRLDQRDL